MLYIYIKELNFRLLYCFFSLLITWIVCYIYSNQIVFLLSKPLLINSGNFLLGSNTFNPRFFIFTNLTEAFEIYLFLAFVSSLVFTGPFILYNIWFFFKPGLYKFEWFFVRFFIFGSLFFLIFSLLFTYNIVIPAAWSFFLSFEFPVITDYSVGIHLEPRISEYFYLLVKLFFYFCLFFQIPWILVLLTTYGYLNYVFLYRFRKFVVVFIFLICALLTPPDLFSQVFLAIPFIFFYEFIILYNIFLKKYLFL
uniref:Sec-independent protein translocase TatC n=1 Tax=Palpitomonas bilix TaxID=652834 RepID=A0A1E1GHN4_9EUKA|nr:Sec-independent protein translocase TatC [Palpitomonas bilix]YP_009317275.1 Sec-independent protein translocase TatC [Palpitomonas bilix]BAV82378.1 Sec-independent protein translocase TatC [Palpitomonas bilix]BAV82443.1 Sec-independent protein translocase TatC [Palpitomonas bilix]